MRHALVLIAAMAAAPFGGLAEPSATAPDGRAKSSLGRNESTAQAMARHPERFDPASGMRTSHYRAPTPSDIPDARLVDHDGLLDAIARGAALLDVALDGAGTWFGAPDGWVGATPRATIPGALWAPGLGRGALDAGMEAYLDAALAELTRGGPRPVVVFCFSDCWMSWNAARRLAARLDAEILWYPLGVDGWLEHGGRLGRVAPFVPPA